jgi:hypothetical protein
MRRTAGVDDRDCFAHGTGSDVEHIVLEPSPRRAPIATRSSSRL